MALEYEVREEYRDYSVAQLLQAPVNCFQGVGDIQSDILRRYFGVTTVQELANLPSFLQALAVQDLVLSGGAALEKTVEEIAQEKPLPFTIRESDRQKQVDQLLEAPAHVLEGLTPAQDLAFYDAFRITNLMHLAHNRIMLEARVIDYLAQEGSAEPGDGREAVASILGARQAVAGEIQAARERLGETGGSPQEMAAQVTEHVRDRIQAMRNRVQDRVTTRETPDARVAGLGATASRIDTIRESRERAGMGGRSSELERLRGTADAEEERTATGAATRSSRVADILSTRGPLSREEGAGEEPGNRVRAVLEARERMGTPRTGAAATRAESPRRAATATATPPRPTPAPPRAAPETAAGTVEKQRAGGPTPAGVAEPAAPPRRTLPPRRRGPAPGVLVAAAVVLVLLVIGLVIYLMQRGEPAAPPVTQQQVAEPAPTAEAPPAEPAPESGAPQAEVTPGTGAPGTEAQVGAVPGPTAQAPTVQAPTAEPSAVPAEPPKAQTEVKPPTPLKGEHTVRLGDSLWRISKREYQDPLNWPSIFEENRGEIEDPDMIYPRQVFRIPAKPEYRFPLYPKGYRQ